MVVAAGCLTLAGIVAVGLGLDEGTRENLFDLSVGRTSLGRAGESWRRVGTAAT